MTFLNPAFGWGFGALLFILALYLLKRRYEERQVPSTFLWRKAARDQSANHPFQRLRRNILLPIQLLMTAILVLALMQPIIPGGIGGNVVMIFDLSASMQAEKDGRTRLQTAVSTAKGIVAGLGAQDALTILAVDGETRQVLSHSIDRDAAYRALDGLRPSHQDCDLSSALSLAEAMEKELGEMNILVFSDNYTPSTGIAAYNAEDGLDNRAVMSFTVENGIGYARIANYGAECELTLVCYAEDTLCDARTLRIPAGETAGLSLNVPDCAWSFVEIQNSDAIQADNRLYFVPKLQKSYTVALSGEDSIFLEQAVLLRDDLRLVKTTDEERLATEADLYIYGASPLFFSLDPAQNGITADAEIAPIGTLTLSGRDALTAGMTLSNVAVRAYRPLSGGRALMTLDGNSVMSSTGRTVALGFDIHDTNLPMKYDFPILIQNVLHALLPETAADIGEGISGEGIRIPLPIDGKSAQVTLPSGRVLKAENMEDWNSAGGFSDTEEVGLYTLSITDQTTTEHRYFSLRMPLSESDVRTVAPSVDAGGEMHTLEGGLELTNYLLGLFLLLLLLEWGVSRRVG